MIIGFSRIPDGSKVVSDERDDTKVGESLDFDSDDGLNTSRRLFLVDPELPYNEDDFCDSLASDSEESNAASQEADDNSSKLRITCSKKSYLHLLNSFLSLFSIFHGSSRESPPRI